jgi:hypothetical protein
MYELIVAVTCLLIIVYTAKYAYRALEQAIEDAGEREHELCMQEIEEYYDA